MKEKKRGETILSLFFLAFFVVLTLMSLSYASKARRLPLIVGIPGVALAAVEVARGMRRPILKSRRTEAGEVQSAEPRGQGVTEEQRKIIGMIGWVVLLVAMIWVLGFLITIPVYTFVSMKVRRENWLASILFAVIGFAVLYFLFIATLNIELHSGLLFGP